MHAHKPQKSAGFTLIEMLVVMAIIGILAIIVTPFFKGMTTDGNAKVIAQFVQGAANNWRLINMKCGTSNDTANSTIVTPPSVTNSLGLIVSGSGQLNTTYTSCYAASGVVALHGKATGNITNGFKIAGYPVTWSGGSGNNPVAFVITGLTPDVAHILYTQYSSANGANASTELPTTADATDPMFRFTQPTGGTTDVTILIP